MAKKYFTDESLATFVDEIKNYTDDSVNDLSSQVAYIDAEDNENVESPDISATSIVIDSSLSSTSTNPVQNKVISAKLNKLEEDIANIGGSSTGGSGGGMFVVECLDAGGHNEPFTTNKTFQEIEKALKDGKVIYLKHSDNYHPLKSYYPEEEINGENFIGVITFYSTYISFEETYITVGYNCYEMGSDGQTNHTGQAYDVWTAEE